MEDPLDVAGVFGVRALALARLFAIPTGILLGLQSDSVDWTPALVNSVFAAVWVLATNRVMLREGLDRTATLVIAAVDVVVVTVGLTVTGGVNSDMRWLLGVLPLAAAFEFRPAIVVAVGAGGASLMTALSLQDPAELGINLVVLAWSTCAGLALAQDRRALLVRIADLARTRGRLLAAHDDAAVRERERAVEELRLGALGEVRAARARLRDPAGTAAAAELCRSAAARIRGLVSELHALSARPIALRTAVEALAARREQQTGRRIATSVDLAAQGDRDDLVLVLVRDLLDGVGARSPRSDVAVAVRATARGPVLEVVADAPATYDTLALARVRERLWGAPGAELEVAGGTVTVRFGAAQPPAPARALPPTHRTLLVARLAGAVAVLALAGIAGTTAASFWIPAGAGFILVVVGSLLLRERAIDRRAWIAVAIVEALAALAALALAGPGQEALLLLFVGFVPVYACVFGPRTVAGFVTGLGAGAVAVAGFDLAFVVAYVWAAGVAVVFAAAAAQAARVIAELLERRRTALARLLESEEAARRTVARRLHDDALQLLLAARQDAEEAVPGGDETSRERAASALAEVELLLGGSSLRQDVDRPPEGGLGAGLVDLVGELRGRGGPSVALRVEGPGEGEDDGLLLGLARELATNAVRHAHASTLSLTVVRASEGTVRLVVADDGVGMAPGREAAARAEGHFGLAAARDRIRRRGGSLEIAAGPDGRGTTVTVALPARS